MSFVLFRELPIALVVLKDTLISYLLKILAKVYMKVKFKFSKESIINFVDNVKRKGVINCYLIILISDSLSYSPVRFHSFQKYTFPFKSIHIYFHSQFGLIYDYKEFACAVFLGCWMLGEETNVPNRTEQKYHLDGF